MKNQIIEKFGMLVVASFIISIITPCQANAAQFAIVGPRALGMGGASVAAVNDSTAVYWNPAALAQFKKVDIRIPAGAAIRDHMSLKDNWDEINDIYDQIDAGSTDPALATRLDQLLTILDKPDTGADIDAHAGLLAAIPIGKLSIGLSALGISYAGMYPTIDTANRNLSIALPVPANSIANNDSAVTGIGLLSVEPGVALAMSIADKLFIGANAKIMSVKTYVHSDVIRTADFNDFRKSLDDSETTSNEVSIDAGILLAPTKNFNIGIVGRYLNSPSFPLKGIFTDRDITGTVTFNYDTTELEIEPQFRAGLAFKPIKMLTLTADYDISKNKTLTPGFEDQTLAVGAELTLPAEIISIRGGGYKNLANSDSNVVYTAGLGFRVFAFRFDFAGAYDFDEREYQASVDIALRF